MKHYVDEEVVSYMIYEYTRSIPVRILRRILDKLPENVTHLDVNLIESYDEIYAECKFIERREKTQEDFEKEKQEHQRRFKVEYLRAKAIVDNFEKQ